MHTEQKSKKEKRRDKLERKKEGREPRPIRC